MRTSPCSFCCAVILFAAVGLLPVASADDTVAIFLVRHTEKDTDDPRDPQLSEKGRARADALARLLSSADVSHLYSSQFKRTHQTLAPLAALSKAEVTVIRAQDPESQLAALRALPAGSVAVVAGHSNTIPNLVCELGGRPADLDCAPDKRALDESEYDRLYLVLLPAPGKDERAPLQTLSLRYGD